MFSSNLFGVSEKRTAGWFASLFGGGASESGIRVGKREALSITAYQRCVTLLSESIAQLPIAVYRKDGKGGRAEDGGHPVAKLLAGRGHWVTPFDAMQDRQIAAGTEGNSYSLIERDGNGTPLRLHHLDPMMVQVMAAQNGEPFFRLLHSNEVVPRRYIHHVRWWSLDGYVGESPLKLHANALGLALAQERHTSKVFANGAQLGGVLQRPAEKEGLKPEAVQKLTSEFEKRFSGANAFKIAMLQEGMTYQPLSMDNKAAQLIDSRKLSVNEICRIYGIPPHMVGDLDRATFSNIEDQGIQFVVYCLLPWVKRHEQALMRDLLLDDERDEVYIEFNVSGLLRGNQSDRYAAYALGRQWGWLSINDIRRLENLPPVKNGNDYLAPLNMAPVGTKQEPSKQAIAEIEAILEE